MSTRNNRRRILAMPGLATGILAASNVVCAQIPCGYEVTAVIQADPCAPPFDNPPPTIGLGISDEPSPRVVGYYFPCVIGPETAFHWSAEEGLTTLGFPVQTSQSWARDISGDGTQIVGTAVIVGVGSHAYLFDDGKFIEIPPPAGTFSNAQAVSLGRVVGTTSDGTPYSKAYIWHEGRMTIIEPTYGPRSSGVDLNDMAQAQVVGWMGPTVDSDAHAFLWENCQMSDLGVVPGGYTGVGTSINSLGQITIAGKLVNPDGGLWLKKGFLWDQGRWSDLGALPGYDRTNPSSMNDAAVIVGTCGKASNPNDARPFIWRDGVIRDLNDLIPPESGIYLAWALAINQAGQITGRATMGGHSAAFLLTPVPPPIGDLDGDCQVGAADLLILLANWGSCDDCGKCSADFNGDCAVGASDLLVLLSNWG